MQPNESPPTTSRGVLLIVEDEAAVVEMLRDYFAGEGYEIDVAMNGGDALMLASFRRPDVVLLDLKLPDTSGAEVLGKLRELDDSLTVVMLSGADDEEFTRTLLKEAGAFDFVRKPFSFDELGSTVQLAIAVGARKPPQDSTCRVCEQAISDVRKAVMDEGRRLLHAACWRRRGMPAG